MYESVAEDAVPPYPVVVVETSRDLDGNDTIGGAPVGKPLVFLVLLVCSVAFDVVGFLFTFLFSITHVGNTGARAGLGFTMIKHALLLMPLYAPNLPSFYHTFSWCLAGSLSSKL